MLPKAWAYRRVTDYSHPTDQTVQTGPFGAQLHADDYVDEGVPFVLIRNIKGNRVDPIGIPRISYADATRLTNYALQKGDIVFSRVGRVGSCFLTEADNVGWIISGQLLRMRLDVAELDPRFMIHWIGSPYVERHILGESVGTTRQSINSSILANMPIPAIAKDEQAKISEILDTIDITIFRTEAIIEKLKQVKQGLLHDLLTRGIDANGELRPPQSEAPHLFKGSPLGWIPREWRVETVRGVIEGTPRNGIYKPAGDIGSGALLVGQTAFTPQGSLDFDQARRVRVSNSELELFGLAHDDLLVSRVFATREGVGQPVLVPSLAEPAVYESNMMRLRVRERLMLPRLLFLWLKQRTARAWVMSRAFASNQSSINRETICGLPVPVQSMEEQGAILTIERAHEQRLCVEMSGLKKAKELKSGLMDELLTGRVRVTPLLA